MVIAVVFTHVILASGHRAAWSATPEVLQSSLRDEGGLGAFAVRGLKPTSTVIASLRDEWQLATAEHGSYGFTGHWLEVV